MGTFYNLTADAYTPDLHVTAKHLRNGIELSFCQPLTLPDDGFTGASDMKRWGNIVHYLLQQRTPQFVEDFYVSSYPSLERRFGEESSQLRISYFHQDPGVVLLKTLKQGLWREAILEFTASTTLQAACVRGQYTGGMVQAVEQGTLAGYVALPTKKVFGDLWRRFFSDDIGSALGVLLYGKELQLYDSLRCKDPFECSAGSTEVSIRISDPTVRTMKNALALTGEIEDFFSAYKPLLEDSFRKIRDAHDIREKLRLSELQRNEPLFQTVSEREARATIAEKLKRPSEVLQTLRPQFPKSLLSYVSLPA